MGSSDARFRALDHIFHLLVLLTAFGQVQSKCPPPYEFDNDQNLCLFENHERNTFDRSVEICNQNDGVLSSPTTTGNYIFGTSDTYWVGVEDRGTGDGQKLLDGSDLGSEAAWFSKSFVTAYSRECGLMTGGSGMTMEKCDRKEKSLCERKPVCDASWHGFEDHCYFISEEKKTWSEAREVCKQHDADLVSIHNLEEKNFILSEIARDCRDKDSRCDDWAKNGHCETEALHMGGVCPKACGFCDGNCPYDMSYYVCSTWAYRGSCRSIQEACPFICGCDTDPGFWIGHHTQNDMHQYEYADKSEVKLTDNYGHNNEECAVMRLPNGTWTERSCDSRSRGFVCQKPKSFKDKNIQDLTIDVCPYGEIGYKDKCYAYRENKVTWEVAKTLCERNNQSLAIIPNREAYEFLGSQFYNLHGFFGVWIGLHYIDGSAKWVDGSMFNDTLEDLSKEGMCGAFTFTGWEADPCVNMRHFLCEAHRGVYKVPKVTVPRSTPGYDIESTTKPEGETTKHAKSDEEAKKPFEAGEKTKKNWSTHVGDLGDQKTKEAEKSGLLSGDATIVMLGGVAGLALILVVVVVAVVVLMDRRWQLSKQISTVQGDDRKKDLKVALHKSNQEKKDVYVIKV